MFRFKARQAVAVTAVVLVLVVNIAMSLAYNFHEPTKDKMTKVYKANIKGYASVDDYRLHNIYKKGDLRYRLSQAFPYEKSTEQTQRNIWQTWKTNDFQKIDKGLQDLIRTFQLQTEEEKGAFHYELISDAQLDGLVNRTFAEVPEVADAFHKLPKIILKSDFVRYLLVYAFGGAYSDVDTSLNTDSQDWLTYNETVLGQPNQVGVVVGIESDRDEKSWARNGMARRVQFCQWTLQAKRGHPLFRELVARITEVTLDHYDPKTNVVNKYGTKYDMSTSEKFAGILEWTGPAMYTDVVFDYLNEVYKITEALWKVDFKQKKMVDPNRPLNLQNKIKFQMLKNSVHNDYDPVESPMGWQNITKQEHPILFDDDVLLLPHRYFGGKKGQRDDYTQHHFKGSWKS